MSTIPQNSLLLRNIPSDFEEKALTDLFEKAGEIVQTFKGRTSLIVMFADESTKEGAMPFDGMEVEDSKGLKYQVKIEEVEHFEVEKYDKPMKNDKPQIEAATPVMPDLMNYSTPHPPGYTPGEEQNNKEGSQLPSFSTPYPYQSHITPSAESSNRYPNLEVDMKDEFKRRIGESQTIAKSEEKERPTGEKRSGKEVDLKRIENEIDKLKLPDYQKNNNPLSFIYSYHLILLTFSIFVGLAVVGLLE
jgi:RNA recognition motif-containing protein